MSRTKTSLLPSHIPFSEGCRQSSFAVCVGASPAGSLQKVPVTLFPQAGNMGRRKSSPQIGSPVRILRNLKAEYARFRLIGTGFSGSITGSMRPCPMKAEARVRIRAVGTCRDEVRQAVLSFPSGGRCTSFVKTDHHAVRRDSFGCPVGIRAGDGRPQRLRSGSSMMGFSSGMFQPNKRSFVKKPEYAADAA